ncbi:MAG: hypothetical protein COB24_09180 [Hyphomicrobiales bacterium]|nr:MAG: hypothetical protein COB24_09180 [Hyphomicrobiales bacterium]
MIIFECEYMCYKFNIKELKENKQYNIYIYCDSDDIEFESVSDYINLKIMPGQFGPSLILNYFKGDFRKAFIHAQQIIDNVLLGSLLLSTQQNNRQAS